MSIQLGKWQGKMDMLAVTLDEFELMLRIKFLKIIQAAIVPHLGGLLIIDDKNPYFVAYASKEKKGKDVMLSSHQVV